MIIKLQAKKEAIVMRENGATYREILRSVPVAKSTLSLWLRSVGLSKRQKQRITLKRIEAGKRGAEAQKDKRRSITKIIKEQAKAEIAGINIGRNELWLMGIMLYWAEGTKEKAHSRPTGVIFSNSDPSMIILFVRWLIEICNIPENQIGYELYVHQSSIDRLGLIKKHWVKVLGLKEASLQRIYFKRNKLNTKRKNINEDYFGLIRVVVKASCNLNRKIAGWIEGINQYFAG